MKKILPVLLFIAFSGNLSAQLYNNYLPELLDSQRHIRGYKKMLSVGLVYDLNSTGVNNSLYNDYLYSNYLKKESRESVLDDLSDNNRFGAYAEQFIKYYFESKKNENLWLGLEVKNRRHYGIVFPKDGYELVMFGNSRFAGKEANLDNTNLFRMNYQVLSAGAKYTKNKFTYGGNIGFVHGTRFTDVKIKKGRVYTSPTGDSIAATADVEASYANLRGVEYRTAGLGASININFSYRPNEKSELLFAVNDVGFIRFFGAESRTFKTNQTISYKGFEANAFSRSLSPSNFEALPQRLVNEVDSAEQDMAYTEFLPAQMHFMYSQYMGKKTKAIFGVEYFFNSYHLPGVHLNVLQEITPWLNIMGGVNVLGFGKYGINLAAQTTFKNIALTAGTEHAEAAISPSNTYGQNGYIRLSLML